MCWAQTVPNPWYAPSSFRSEAFGVLAVRRLIFHLVQVHGPIESNIAHHMDNQGVKTRLKELNERVQEVPRNCFKAEWDVLIEVKNTMAMFGGET